MGNNQKDQKMIDESSLEVNSHHGNRPFPIIFPSYILIFPTFVILGESIIFEEPGESK